MIVALTVVSVLLFAQTIRVAYWKKETKFWVVCYNNAVERELRRRPRGDL